MLRTAANGTNGAIDNKFARRMGRNGQGDGDKGCRSYIKSIGHRLLFEFQVLNVPT